MSIDLTYTDDDGSEQTQARYRYGICIPYQRCPEAYDLTEWLTGDVTGNDVVRKLEDQSAVIAADSLYELHGLIMDRVWAQRNRGGGGHGVEGLLPAYEAKWGLPTIYVYDDARQTLSEAGLLLPEGDPSASEEEYATAEDARQAQIDAYQDAWEATAEVAGRIYGVHVEIAGDTQTLDLNMTWERDSAGEPYEGNPADQVSSRVWQEMHDLVAMDESGMPIPA